MAYIPCPYCDVAPRSRDFAEHLAKCKARLDMSGSGDRRCQCGRGKFVDEGNYCTMCVHRAFVRMGEVLTLGNVKYPAVTKPERVKAVSCDDFVWPLDDGIF